MRMRRQKATLGVNGVGIPKFGQLDGNAPRTRRTVFSPFFQLPDAGGPPLRAGLPKGSLRGLAHREDLLAAARGRDPDLERDVVARSLEVLEHELVVSSAEGD